MTARFPIQPGEAITACALGPLQERHFPGEARAMVDKVDYRFVNGWVDVGDLPCREATWAEIETRQTPSMPEFETVEVRLPGFSKRIDFSHFWHIPHRLERAAKLRLVVPEAGAYPLRVATCGGVNIWVDGQHVAAFEPYTRNARQETDVLLPLAAGGSDVVILAEDMAERDTQFFIELTWLGEIAAEAEVPVDADPQTLDLLMALARDIRPDAVFCGAGQPLRLVVDAPVPQPVTIEAAVPRSVHLRHLPPLWQGRAVMEGRDVCFDIGALGDALHPLELTLSVGATRVTRKIAFAKLTRGAEPLRGTLKDRKAQALAHAAMQGEPRIGRVLARRALGHAWSPEDAEVLADTLDGITRRRDCSDFVMVPLLWLLARYDVPGKAKDAVLGYRYWMTEPGNDAMWFWSENHVLCFHVSQYLAGRLYPDEMFRNAGVTGEMHAAQAEARLIRWFDAVERDGLAEWNSAAYYPIDFIGLLALAELGDGTIRARARALLDQLFTMIALHTCGGVSAGSMGRAYDKELRAGPLTELTPFAAVAFGHGWLNEGVAALPMFCLTDYAPPDGLAALAAPEHPVEARYVQGHGTQGRLGLYKTAHMQLSAAIDAPPGAQGHQQHLVDVQAASAPFARVWINHPGSDDPWGEARPSYWAGNGVLPRIGMQGDTVLYLSGAEGIGFTHAYAPLTEFDEARIGPDYMALRAGQGAILLMASGPIARVTTGPGAGLEWRCFGARTGWAVQIREGDLDALEAEAQAMRLTLGKPLGETLGKTLGTGPFDLTLSQPGRAELRLDHARGLFVDGAPCPFPTTSTRPVIQRHAPELTHA